jgi:mannosyltransferase
VFRGIYSEATPSACRRRAKRHDRSLPHRAVISRLFSSSLGTDSLRPSPVPSTTQEGLPRRLSAGLVVVGLVLTVAVVLRFLVRSPLWLDEAISVSIARLPLRDIPEALRHDGAPPLYYLLLKGWLALPGMSDEGARWLSGILAVLSLPPMAAAGRRLGDRETGRAALLVLASSPFAIYYATEARMYSLLVLLALIAGLLLCRVLEAGRARDVIGLALAVTALMLTHYWSVYPLAAAAGWLAWQWRKGRPRARLALAGLAGGVVGTAPWWPIAIFQLLHTGTPWASYLTVNFALGSLRTIAGGRGDAPVLLQVLYLLLAFLGAFGVRRDSAVELRWPPRGPGALLSGAWVATLVLAGLAGLIFGVGFASRYTSVILPAVLLAVVAGISALPSIRARTLVLWVTVFLGLVAALPNTWTPRTTAGRVASTLNREAKPGDLVVYCPDQLAPAVSRLLKVPLDQITFPPADDLSRVDWLDYRKRVRAAGEPEAFAHRVLGEAGTRDLWLVWAPGYRSFSGQCNDMRIELQKQREDNVTVVSFRRRIVEYSSLVHFPAS